MKFPSCIFGPLRMSFGYLQQCRGFKTTPSPPVLLKALFGMASKKTSPAKPLLLLSNEEVKKYLKWEELFPAIETALGNFSKDPSFSGISQPVRTTVIVKKHNGYLFSMPVYSEAEDVLVTKLVSNFPNNNQLGIPSHISKILMFDSQTGHLKAVIDADTITAMRTAAASAIATKYLAPSQSKILALIGAGVQAKSHYQALSKIIDFKEVKVWNKTTHTAESLVAYIIKHGTSATLCNTVEDAVTNADVIVTATLATKPILEYKWIKPSAHINGIGACRPDWQELSAELVKKSTVIVDSKAAALQESGDIIISEAPIYAELGEIINGCKKSNRNTLTFFKSLGVAVEDAVTTKIIYNNYMKSFLRLT